MIEYYINTVEQICQTIIQLYRKANKLGYRFSYREKLMTDLKYLDRMARDRVSITKGKLRDYRASLSSMTSLEKCEFKLYLARSKRLTYLERVKFKVAFPREIIKVVVR